MKINDIVLESELEEDWKSDAKKMAMGALAGGVLAGVNTDAITDYLNKNSADKPSIQKSITNIPSDIKKEVNVEYNRIKEIAKKAGIRGHELAQFLAQTSVESGNYKSLIEPKGDARKYEPNVDPRKARMLGNRHPGDGVKYRGRGYIQLTGKYNYEKAGQALGLDLVNHPELAEDPKNAMDIAVWYWKTRVRPKVSDFTNTVQVTHPINKGLSALDKRDTLYQKYKNDKDL